MLEAFKGDQYDWRNESSAKIWATGYDFPAVAAAPSSASSSTAQERPRACSASPSTCDATNSRSCASARHSTSPSISNGPTQNLFYGQYVRTASYFDNSELAQSGLPSAGELAILNAAEAPSSRRRCSPRDTPTRSTTRRRSSARTCARPASSLTEAGWKVRPATHLRQRATGEPMTVEFLLDSPTFERIALPYQSS